MRPVAEAKTGAAIVIHPDGQQLELAEKPNLITAQGTVGGYVQLIRLPDGRQMLMDEEGLLKRKPPNPKATELVNGAGVLVHEVGIVGTVLVLEGSYRWE